MENNKDVKVAKVNKKDEQAVMSMDLKGPNEITRSENKKLSGKTVKKDGHITPNIDDNKKQKMDTNKSLINPNSNSNPKKAKSSKKDSPYSNASVLQENEREIEKEKDLQHINKLKNENSHLLKEIEELKIKEQECQDKLKNLEEDQLKEKENLYQMKLRYEKLIEDKNSHIKDKDKALNSINATNIKLMQTLEDLKKEVDDQFDKVSFKQVSDKMKKSTKEDNKQNPLEIVLKVKEKELKNTINLMEILKKNNEQLQKSLDTYTDYKSILEFQDKYKVKEKENLELIQEVKLLNRNLEEHKRCPNTQKEFDNDIKILKEDLRKNKDLYKVLQGKLKESENKYQKTMDQLISVKRENGDLLPNISPKKPLNNVDEILKNYGLEEKKKVISLNHDANVNDVLKTDDNKDATLIKDITINKVNISKAIKPDNNNLRSINTDEKSSKSQKNISRTNRSIDDPSKRLFSVDERLKLEKYIPKNDLEKYEKKYIALEHSKISIENKNKSDLKLLLKKVSDQEEQLEYLQLQYKESEQRSKIFQFQVNEYKNEQRAYQRKLNEVQINTDHLNNLIKEKDQENKLLMHQLNSYRKMTKHNAVLPIDDELSRHLEKIKSEENSDNNIPDINNESFRIENEKLEENASNMNQSRELSENDD